MALRNEVSESGSKRKISALELELEAAQTALQLEKLRSQSARERIVLLYVKFSFLNLCVEEIRLSPVELFLNRRLTTFIAH